MKQAFALLRGHVVPMGDKSPKSKQKAQQQANQTKDKKVGDAKSKAAANGQQKKPA